VARIAASAERMEIMISQLLDFTRIRLGRGILLEPSEVDLGEVARSIIEELEPVRRREINLELTGDVIGTWDRDRLSQLLSNLAGNACQHGTPEAPVAIRLDGTQNERIRIEMWNGGAIPKHLLPVIFEPLRQAGDHAEKQAGPSGLGLGLYITQQIAFAHGGTIGVRSNEADGTRFVIELPRHPSSPTESVFIARRRLH
jgi:signal transduction histidine kinase